MRLSSNHLSMQMGRADEGDRRSDIDASGSSYASGLIGFLVGGDSAGGTEAVFSNVWVFQK